MKNGLGTKNKLGVAKGFTMIEVMLVLAIAGAIIAMMLIALPALQRQARDAQRKEDVNALVNAIKKYQTNNRGALPTTTSWNKVQSGYLESGFTDPSGIAYSLVPKDCSGTTTGRTCLGLSIPSSIDYNMYVVTSAACGGDDTSGAVASSNPRRFAVLYKLEGGGVYCEGG